MSWAAIFIIVFREALEVVLTLVLIMAATRSLAKRSRWIVAGFAIGLFGSFIVAGLTGKISESMQGMGQEVFNATLLAISAILIGFTVIWMRSHSRSLVQNLKETSIAVVQGRRPMYALSLIVGLTVLRDGSEVVLLSQGLFASGVAMSELFFGALLGVAAGAILGTAMYFGIVKLKASFFFDVLALMLIFVAAGMAAQAAGFLAASGMLPPLLSPAWDSSKILSEHTWFGELAHVLFGYTARPSGMQLVWYAATLVLILFGWQRANPAPAKARSMLAAGLALFIFVAANIPSSVNAIDKIYSPMIDAGEMEIETRGTYEFDEREDRDGIWVQKTGIGGSIGDWWALEANIETKKKKGENLDVEAVILESRCQLTEKAEYWLDLGLYFEFELATQSESPNAIEGKILLEKSHGKFEQRLNIILEKEVGGYSEEDTEGAISAVSRYRLNKNYEPGLEWHSSFGELNDSGPWSNQEHNIGPSLYGDLGGGFSYELAVLFGVSTEATDTLLRGAIEYEWY